MITVHTGDIFDSKAHTLVNPVNCRGAMGAGLALQFRHRYPGMFARYSILCQQKVITPGSVMFDDGDGQHIANMATKDHWKMPSEMTWIHQGLKTLAGHLIEEEVPSVAVPPVGCGLGGLRFREVAPLITHYLGQTDSHVMLYTPSGQQKIALAAAEFQHTSETLAAWPDGPDGELGQLKKCTCGVMETQT